MSKAQAVENKEILQAILIADSHNDNLQPFTSTKPLALLPIANVPLIEYALESLNRNGVEEVIVFCCNHIDQVKRYIQQRQTARCTWSIGMKVSIVSSESCRSIGEAIRDLDARNTIRGNVLLLGVDSVTNADLAALLDEHKRLSKLDRGAVMTVVYKEGLRRMRTGNEVMIAMEPRTRRLLFHQRLAAQQEKERKFELPLELFLGNRDVAVCHGLLDPQIAVCSHAALPLFADNFDFLSRDDFVRGVLINEEILNSRIYVAKLAREEYAMRVNNWQSYHLVSLDVINRWLYPMVPDTAISEFRQQYKHFRNNIYRHGNVRLSRSCELDGDLVVGEESEIREGTYLRQSVVGRGCQIGRNCRIVNSFLMEGASVGDGTVLNHCILGERVKVGEGCTINPGTVLGEGVEIPDRLVVAGLLLQANEPPADEWGTPVQKIADRAYTIPVMDEDDSDSDEDDDKLGQPAMNQPLVIAPLPGRYPASVYEPSDDEGDSRPASPVPEDENIFLSEVVESLKRGFSERTNAEYLILEINSSRYAYNMALCEVNYYVVKAILLIMLQQDGVATNTVGTLRRLLAYFGVVFRNYIRDREAMMNCLRAFEEMCPSSETVRAKLPQLVHYLYEEDLISEEVIIDWHEGLEDVAIKTTLSKLVQWLQESSEEEEEDDED
ncbi:translation initiation factor eIF-2B subunit epsilon-like [Anopheles stephensi]|uniref:translation initiation factor eIF-2B subunit epsilon-like n=1 Tax=Anopheles stephensi TaxID=30069 RepID=UPI001658A60B|nr:translation initiation factor eIF-2B subunit epsilon-like [Anopheles stephensi]